MGICSPHYLFLFNMLILVKMRLLYIFIFLTTSCAPKLMTQPGSLEQIIGYKAVFNVSIGMLNNDPQINKLIPVFNVNLVYTVVTNGNQSFIHITQDELKKEQGITISSNEMFAYTECSMGMGITIDSVKHVIEPFLIKSIAFIETRDGEVNFNGINLKCKAFNSTNPLNINITATNSLPPSINLGTCYLLPFEAAILKMSGKNDGLEIYAELIRYEKTDFDFTLYSEILARYKNNTPLKSFDLFWN